MMTWKDASSTYVSGDSLYLGRWKVGSVFYDGARPRGALEVYRADCSLPGIKADLGGYETVIEARAAVERAVNHWIKHSGLK